MPDPQSSGQEKPEAIYLEAPAKINWFLHVLGKRPDGFHEIHSLMQRITLSDTLAFSEHPDLFLEDESGVPGEENHVLRAARLLAGHFGRSKESAGALIRLKKNIPIGAGLGGGSSDAVAALRGLAALWSVKPTEEELYELAARLGSDMPFFLGSPAAVVRGRGEVISPLAIRRFWVLLLVNPGIHVSTARAYGSLEAYSDSGALPADEDLREMIEQGEFDRLGEVVVNDLARPVTAMHPEIGRLIEGLRGAGALYSAMTGSGSTVFGVFPGYREAQAARSTISQDPAAKWTTICETVA